MKSVNKAALSLVLCLTLSGFLVGSAPSVSADGAPTEASGFSVLSANWGTATSSVSVGPGSQYVPLTVTMQYYFANAANNIQLLLTLPAGFTDANGGTVSLVVIGGPVTSGSTVTATFYVSISPSVNVGTYFFPFAISWAAQVSSQQSVALAQHTYTTVYLRGKALLSFQAPQSSLTPGQVNNLQIVMSNTGSGPATQITTSVTTASTSAISVLTQFPFVSALAPGSNFSSTLKIFVPSTAAGSASAITLSASYADANGNSATASQTVGLYAVSSAAVSAVNYLTVTATLNSLTAGARSPVAFSIKNTGQQTVYSPAIALTVSSPLVVSANSTVTLPRAALSPGGSILYSAEVTTGTGATGGFYTGTLTITFTDQLGGSFSQSVPVAFMVTVPITQIIASSVASQVGIGRTTTVSFMITNSGTTALYSPTFALTVPTGLAVTANATFSRPGLVINPGQGVRYVANVTTGPKTSEAAYIATLSVTYADHFGNSHSSSFSMGLVAVGVIQMVLQNEKTSIDGSVISVTGTLLNEGLANAYYTQVTVALSVGGSRLSSSTSYVGEVDSNTPLPVSLTLTIPESVLASANRTATLTFVANYQNDYGQALQYTAVGRVSLSAESYSGGSRSGTSTSGASAPSSTAQQTLSAGAFDIIRYGAIAGILVAVAVTILYVRRGRSRGGFRKPDVY